MGVSHRVKTKYIFRFPLPLPLAFLKPKRTNTKPHLPVDDDTDTGDEEGEIYRSVPPAAVRVRYESESEIESDESENDDKSDDDDDDEDIDPLDISNVSVSARHTKRLVSWGGVKDRVRCRWTAEQEQKLVFARAQLERCQRAWSSEQDVWLKCIETLNEEKKAYEGFITNRAKHISNEQHHFRKACDRDRRRSEQDQLQGVGVGVGQPQRLTPAHRTASLPVRLGRLRSRNY